MLIHSHYIVKQEIAKEGVIPFSLFLQQNINLIPKIFSKNIEDQPVDSPNHRIPGQSPFEPIPVPALLLHCFFTCVLVFSTCGINPPQNS